MVSVPLDGFLKTAREIVVGRVAEELAYLGNVGIAMADIAFARGSEDGWDVNSKCFCDGVIDIDEDFAAAIRDIERLPVGFSGSKTGLEVRLDDIFDVGEIAALLPVAMDGGGLSLQEETDELGDDGSIGTIGVLTSPKHIEIAQTYRFHSIQ